jgi:membrane dipeptidase
MNDHSLSRRQLLKAGAIGVAGLASGTNILGALAASEGSYVDYDQAFVLDMLTGIGDPNEMLVPEDQRQERGPYQLSPRALGDLRASGTTMINQTLPYVFGEDDPFEVSVSSIARMDETIRRYPMDLIKILSHSDIIEAKHSNRVGVLFGFQNCTQFGDDVGRVDLFTDLGVRCFQLTYNLANQLGSGAMVPENGGLSDFGFECVARLNERRQLIDMSHSGEATCLDTIAASTGPIAITHSGCRAITDLPRNKTDAEMRALADKGGVVGIYWMPFLSTTHQPMAEDLLAHVDHAINICGEDHVGIGSDISVTSIDDKVAYGTFMTEQHQIRSEAGIAAPGESAESRLFLPDMTGPDQYREFAARMYSKGYSSTRIEKILGANFMRLLHDVWGD